VKHGFLLLSLNWLLSWSLSWSLIALLLSAPAATGAEEFIIPVRIHLVHSDQDAAFTTTLTEVDIQRIMGKVNTIWAQANIRFAIESIGKTTALKPPSDSHSAMFGSVVAAMPKDRLLEKGINIFYVKELTPNGFYSNGLIFVKDTARLTEVPGGLDEPIPRVTAHEIGHALSLQHRQEETNLMASGKSGFSLNEAEITATRVAAVAKFEISANKIE